MTTRTSNPNGKDRDAERHARRRKPRSHTVPHPKDPAPVEDPPVEAAPTVITQAAEILEQEQATEPPPALHPGVNEDERERLREALRRCEAANAELARATDRRKRAQAEVDAANTRLQTLVAEISSGTGQPSLPFSVADQEADRNAMLQADREANTPALIERLKRFGWILTREQLDALAHAQRHELAEYVKRSEAAILDATQLHNVALPAVLASMHVADDPPPGEERQHCTLCGMMLQAHPVDFWVPGLRIGSDCPGEDVSGERDTALVTADEEHAAS